MSSNGAKRERHLREERRRRASRKPERANARFQCDTCGRRIETEGSFVLSGSQSDIPIPPDAQITDVFLEVMCPTCGQPARPLNSQRLIMGDKLAVGFADTPDQMYYLNEAMEVLLALDEDASLDEILDVMEDRGEGARLVRDYIRENRDFLMTLAGLGFSFAGLVLALIPYLFPQHPELAQPAPGITNEQRDWLDSEFRKREQGHQAPGSRDEGGQSSDESDVRPERERHAEQGKTGDGAGDTDA